jgi:hypothetical protein
MGGWQAATTVRKALDLARQPRPVREAAGPEALVYRLTGSSGGQP